MNQQAAIIIIIAGGLIAAAIALTNHWALYTVGDNFASFLRLNRWTGTVVVCGGLP
jgi:bacteriorhodopsin